jgi:hypothetical protein
MMKKGYDEKYNDYSYALVHLFEESEDYFQHFVKALKSGRDVILDNSIFELGEAFSPQEFMKNIIKLAEAAGDLNARQHLIYIIPDVLHDSEATLSNLDLFLKEYNCIDTLPGRPMAVIQGKTMEELEQCFLAMSGRGLDRIGIPYICKGYQHAFIPDTVIEGKAIPIETNRGMYLRAAVHGRQYLIHKLAVTGNSLENERIHLLGAALPQEFKMYTTDFDENVRVILDKAIVSLDTSNPVVHGLLSIPYNPINGLVTKADLLLATMLHMPEEDVKPETMKIVTDNIEAFRWLNRLPQLQSNQEKE